ncbi:MAG: cyclic nucleotide-binding domain-containing protein, partial [Lacipirellulaceae bacterium]
DEPTAALDEKTGREVVTLFQEMAKEEGATVIMVTHDNRILDVADRIVNMVQGHIKSDVAVVEASVICEFLRQYPLFAELTPNTLTDMADKMMVLQSLPGDTVIQQGDTGDLFYLIRAGSVEVIVEEGGKEQKVAELGQGQFFGEAALITEQPRNATVRALEETTFYTLGKEDFQAVLNESKTFESELRSVLAGRT